MLLINRKKQKCLLNTWQSYKRFVERKIILLKKG